MQCPKCQHNNRAERRFCAECGATLATIGAACEVPNEPGEKLCGACGAALRDGGPTAAFPTTSRRTTSQVPFCAYTPKHLADKILTSRSALEGERKQVTALFADVKGSMELAERLAPEEWHKISTNGGS